MKATCQVTDCDTDVYAVQICRFHYDRRRRTGTTDDPVRRSRQRDRPCRARACTNSGQSHGLCSGHLERLRAHGDLREDVPLKRFQDHRVAAITGSRACSKCARIKPLSAYGRDGQRRRSECRACQEEREKAKRIPRPREMRDYAAPYVCRSCGVKKPADEYSLVFRNGPQRHAFCRSCQSDRARIYRSIHRDRLNAHHRWWTRQFPEKRAAWKAANRERVREYGRKSRRRHPETQRRANWLRKARKLGAPQPRDRRLMREYAALIRSDPCAYCGAPSVEIDHIVAISKQGSLDWDNLAPACRTCNPSKGNSSLLHFMLRRLS